MSVIYEPKGKAREYSPKALNIYLACTHGCRYCYAPHAIQRSEKDYFSSPVPRKDIVRKLDAQLGKEKIDDQVLLSFIGDPYCENSDGSLAVRDCLTSLYENMVPVAILTKGGKRCLKDLDLFKRFGKSIMVGATLTFHDPDRSLEWEPGAASPQERLETLRILHDNGIKTFASFEPVISPEESLKMMKESVRYGCVDLYKVGKLNGMPSIEKKINWPNFLSESLDILRGADKEVYIKDDLARTAPWFPFKSEERDADLHTVKWDGGNHG